MRGLLDFDCMKGKNAVFEWLRQSASLLKLENNLDPQAKSQRLLVIIFITAQNIYMFLL